MKDIINSKGLGFSIQAFLNDDHWFLLLNDSGTQLTTELSTKDLNEAVDLADFITNFLPTANDLIGQHLRGATDGTPIGNVLDRLKVETVFAPDGVIIPTLGSDLTYEVMDVTNGGVAEGTDISAAWTTIYNKTGLAAGLFLGFLVTLESIEEDWAIRLVLDGDEVFTPTGIRLNRLLDDQIGGFDPSPSNNIPEFIGFNVRKNTFRWEGPNDLPVRLTGPSSEIEILLRKDDSDKKFFAGIAARAVT